MLGGFTSDDDEYAFPGDAVLAKAEKDANGNMVDAVDWRIRPPTRVSPRDASFIRKFYPRDEEERKSGEKRIRNRDQPEKPSRTHLHGYIIETCSRRVRRGWRHVSLHSLLR